MKEISKYLFFLIFGGFMFISCIETDVAFVNKELDNIPKFTIQKNYGDYYLFTHVATTVYVDIVFHVFADNDISNELLRIQNFRLKDDNGNCLYDVEEESFTTLGDKNPTNGLYENIFSFKYGTVPIDRKVLIDKKVKYLTVEYEINGKQFYEKLEREENYLLYQQ